MEKQLGNFAYRQNRTFLSTLHAVLYLYSPHIRIELKRPLIQKEGLMPFCVELHDGTNGTVLLKKIAQSV